MVKEPSGLGNWKKKKKIQKKAEEGIFLCLSQTLADQIEELFSS